MGPEASEAGGLLRIQNAYEDVWSRPCQPSLIRAWDPPLGQGCSACLGRNVRGPRLGRRVGVLMHVVAVAVTNTRDGDKPSGEFQSHSFPGGSGTAVGRSRPTFLQVGQVLCPGGAAKHCWGDIPTGLGLFGELGV